MLTRLKSHDTVIRGGSILDGTGAAAFADDVRSIAV
jgi:N-acyl-D-aspartate/D-glutamate deacylase